MNRGIIGIGLAIWSLATLLATSANAANIDIDGTNCLPSYGATYTWSTSGSITNFGFNNYIDISCPLYNIPGTIDKIIVNYVNNHPTSEFLCVLTTGTGGGGLVQRSPGPYPYMRQMIFDVNMSGNQYGGMHVHCSLPPNTSGAAPSLEFIRIQTL
jgi:hypothetical protein